MQIDKNCNLKAVVLGQKESNFAEKQQKKWASEAQKQSFKWCVFAKTNFFVELLSTEKDDICIARLSE